MPFSMIHLCVANEILKATDKIKNINDFYMGSIVPDAVHLRSHFDTEMKKYSHFVPNPYKWGQFKDNEAWIEYVLENKEKHMKDVDIEDTYSFLMGYYTHVLTDIENNIYVWQPFIKKNKFEDHNGLQSDYHLEAVKMDNYLYQTISFRQDVFKNIKNANEYELEDRLTAKDVENMKQNMLQKYMYLETEDQVDVSKHKHCTIENTNILIEESKKIVLEKLL